LGCPIGSSSSSSSLSGGAIAGIVIGSVVGVILLLIILLCCLRVCGEGGKKKSRSTYDQEHDAPSHDHGRLDESHGDSHGVEMEEQTSHE